MDNKKPANVKEQSTSSFNSKSPTTAVSPKSKKKMPLESSRKKLVCRKAKSVKSEVKHVKSDKALRKSESSKKKRLTTYNDMYDNVEAKFSAFERAERVLSSVDDEYPSFIKCMLPSNVSHGFWLHLPKSFSDMYLPSHDSALMLVDEWGNDYKTSYLSERHGLSAGWRAFSIAHRLLKGDLLIFCLTGPCKLRVHIVRVNGRDVVDAAVSLMNLNDYVKTSSPDNHKRKRITFVEPYLDRACQGERALQSCLVLDQPKHQVDDFALEEGSNISNHLKANASCSRISFLPDHHTITCS
ncbi:hypothetical protein DM860_015206 [Cuscuta australis]|uniref:TF-B3 domain-containing protein n=1 Tax=Cuscuta australis TaxID=267555 RepID=A0A328CZE4_9ASTE|nr:hypothetical protein DM860_015206 [Cuscuta australis]